MNGVLSGGARAVVRAAIWGAWAALTATGISLLGATLFAANPFFDLAAQFLGLGAWACAASALVLLARRSIAPATLAILFAACGLWIVWPRPAIEACAPEAQARRIAFQNVWVWNRSAGTTLAYLRQLDPDIIVLAEVRRRFRDALATLREVYPYALDCRAIGRCDLVILSKFPLTDARDHVLAPGGPDAVVAAEVSLPEGRLHIAGSHPARPWPFAGPYVQRRETQALGEGFAALPSPRLLIGDLNAVTWGRVVRDIERRAEARALPSWGTWQSRIPPLFSLPIDQAIVGPGISCARKTVGPPTGSDHRPIIVDFALAP